MKIFLTILTIILFSPFYVNAKVSITEIAWMGTANSTSDEWIEIYNDADTSVDLSSWSISGSLSISIPSGKSIPPKGLFLLERTDDTTIPDITADYIYTGALTNSGYQSLILKNENADTIDNLIFQTEWPAGDNTTKDTMQWNGTSWVTATPTPKVLNTGISNSTDNNNDNEENDTTIVAKSGGGNFETAPRDDPHIEFIIPKVIYSDVQNEFKSIVVLEYMNPNRGIFIWNMGDGTTLKQTELLPISHTYQYAGKYTISFAYYRSDYDVKPYMTGDTVFDVVDPKIEASIIDDGKALKIKNPSDKKIDLTNWKLLNNSITTIFPEMTIIAPRATIIIPASSLNTTNFSSGSILAPNGEVITSFGGKENIKIVRSSTTYSNFAPLLKASTADIMDDNIVFDSSKVEEEKTQKQKHTKYIIFGVLSLITIGLFILLERFMVRQE